MDPRTEIGQRIARQRRRRGLSQTVVANLVGRSESWLSQVERGKRSIDSHSVLLRLAEVLGVEVGQLTTQEAAEDMTKYEAAAAIRSSMLRYESLTAALNPAPARDDRSSLTWLRHELRRVNRLYQATRYDEAGRKLPGLITAVELATQSRNPDDRRAALALKALTYQSATMILNRVGETELAWTTADRSISAAQAGERPLLGAVGAYRLGYVLIRQKRYQQAEDLAVNTADALQGRPGTRSPLMLSVAGGLYLMGTRAAAGRFDRAAVDHHLASARTLATELSGDRNDFWSAFGPTNVAIHEISTAVHFGDANHAITRGSTLSLGHLGPGLLGRRSQVLLDLARAYSLQRKDAAAVNTLLQAERISPELVRYDNRTNKLLTELVRREHRASTPELRALAHRAGVL